MGWTEWEKVKAFALDDSNHDKTFGAVIMKRTTEIFCCCLIASFSLFLLVALPCYAKEVRGVTNDAIKVAVLSDLTGPAAQASIPYSDALRDYFRYLNEKGRINGRKIKFIVEDDHYSIPIAIAAFKKVVFKDKIFTLFGPSGTGHTVALFKLIEKNNLPTLALTTSEAVIRPFKRHLLLLQRVTRTSLR